jgi:hypothetical protein
VSAARLTVVGVMVLLLCGAGIMTSTRGVTFDEGELVWSFIEAWWDDEDDVGDW